MEPEWKDSDLHVQVARLTERVHSLTKSLERLEKEVEKRLGEVQVSAAKQSGEISSLSKDVLKFKVALTLASVLSAFVGAALSAADRIIGWLPK